ncbi:MAG: sigma-70 family RNA polymerase sigma factor [Pyrinomonadaceae bacterium]|nr:sigma-70 family RNA polymerase sigma factor [Pyrinomonadaceae bacterium]
MLQNQELTQNLIDWRNGNKTAFEKILPVVYDELSAIAHRFLRHERSDVSLQTVDLISEAYLRLIDKQNNDWQNRAHFFAVAATVMRNLLIDHARARKFVKHGGGLQQIFIEDLQVAAPKTEIDVLELHEALNDLAEIDERKARIVELRYFGGLTVEEAAEVISVSEITIKREWLKAKAWLYERLKPAN